MKDFPIPRLDLANELTKAQYDQMSALVEQMLELQRKYQEEGDNREKENLSETVTQLDQRIDRIVYGLYGSPRKRSQWLKEK